MGAGGGKRNKRGEIGRRVGGRFPTYFGNKSEDLVYLVRCGMGKQLMCDFSFFFRNINGSFFFLPHKENPDIDSTLINRRSRDKSKGRPTNLNIREKKKRKARSSNFELSTC